MKKKIEGKTVDITLRKLKGGERNKILFKHINRKTREQSPEQYAEFIEECFVTMVSEISLKNWMDLPLNEKMRGLQELDVDEYDALTSEVEAFQKHKEKIKNS